MFDRIKSWFQPTIIEITVEKKDEDPIQNGVDMVAEGINFLLEHDFEPECMSDLLRQMAEDVETLHKEPPVPVLIVSDKSDKSNVIYPSFKRGDTTEDTPVSEDDQ